MKLKHLCLLFYSVALSLAANFEPKVSETLSSDYIQIAAFDDTTHLLRVEKNELLYSKDNGNSWVVPQGLESGVNVSSFQIDSFFPKRAFAMTEGAYYVTKDQGEHWEKVSIPIEQRSSEDQIGWSWPYIITHASREDYIITEISVCRPDDPDSEDGSPDFSISCEALSLVSSDGGRSFTRLFTPEKDSDVKRTNAEGCRFTRNSKNFQLGTESTILCEVYKITQDADTEEEHFSKELYVTTDFGKTFKQVDQFKNLNIAQVEIVDNYVLVFTQDDLYNQDSPTTLWVSRDAITFHETQLPTQIRSGFFDILGVFNGKIFLSIVRWQKHMMGKKGASEILVSDSTGFKFTKLSSSKGEGFHNLYQIDQLEGVIVDSFSSSYHRRKGPRYHSTISFDNGVTWSNLRIDDPDHKGEYNCDIDDYKRCSLQTFGMSSSQADESYSTGATPGVLMTCGSVSDDGSLEWDKLHTFVSRNGGLSWSKVLDFPVTYAFGDMGNIIVAVPYDSNSDGDSASEIFYSLDQGHTWSEYQLKREIYPFRLFVTTVDGSGSTFILTGMPVHLGQEKENSVIYTIDFSDAFDKKTCKDDDFEDWYQGDGKCVNGAKYKYKRRKYDSQCLVRRVFEDIKAIEEVCDCTENDYECSFEFSRDENGKCVLDYSYLTQSDACKGSKNNVKLPPMKLMLGNKCDKPLQIEPVEIPCNDAGSNSDELVITENTFDSKFKTYQYFDTIADESFIVRTSKNEVYISHDGGQTIQKFDAQGDEIIEVLFNPYFNSSAYLFSTSGKLYITDDRATTFTSVTLPQARQLGFPLSFHAKDPNTFIYYGGKNCDSFFNPQCHAVAYITSDGGQSFSELADGAINCEFVGSTYKDPYDSNMIMCEIKEKNSLKRSLVSSTDFFKSDRTEVYKEIIGYMSTGEYTVVAVPHGNDELRAYISIDGHEFAEAEFPADFTINKQQAYTVLGSQTGALFFHVTTNIDTGEEFGALMKSNSNGTSFVVLEKAVNRNTFGFADFEKIDGLEGIIIINVVNNAKDVINNGKEKKKQLKSKITFNDGADWRYITPPNKDSEGNSYKCSSRSLEKCSLNLHGYTERRDIRDTYSSGSALGVLIAVGSVGEHLLPPEQCSTFMTTDGGITWREIKKGAHQWEYGDRGSVIVLVQDRELTDTITYSSDSGKTWKEYKFTEQKVHVDDIVTVPQDSAMRFLIISTSISIKGEHTKTFAIDFGRCFERQCVFNSDNKKESDFEYVPLKHPDSECLFGHQAEYLQKTNDKCFIGTNPLRMRYKILKNCTCTRNDFECDYNFYKANDGTCKLVEGLTPADPADICKKNTDLVEYYEPTGYRKIPLSTCDGGKQLDKATIPRACPNKQKEFDKKYKVGNASFFFVLFIPLIVFIFAAWFVYDRGIRRNGGFARFGEIRLDDEDLIEENQTDRVVNSIVKSSVIFVSGVFAALQLFKRKSSDTLKRIKEKVFNNRGGPSYSSLMHDQFLDEADDLLAGHDEDANDLASFIENEGNFEVEDEEASGSSPHKPYSDHADEQESSEQTQQGDDGKMSPSQ